VSLLLSMLLEWACQVAPEPRRAKISSMPGSVTCISGAERTPRPKERVFTRYVRALDPAGNPPDEGTFLVLCRVLRASLTVELKRRGLWCSSPRYLGIYGWESWAASSTLADGGRGRSRGALDELVPDCYLFVFVDRLRSLKAQLKIKPNIDGLVFLNLRHFLHERQREHDPVGFRIFQIAQEAVRRAVSQRDLLVLAGDPRIRNDTLLGWSEPAGIPQGKVESSKVEIWGRELMPDLIAAKGKALDGVVERLRERFIELRAEGLETFFFKDFIDPLKSGVRVQWAATLSGFLVPRGSRPPSAGVSVPPIAEERLAEIESYEHLTSRMEQFLDDLESDSRTRSYLLALWRYLRSQAEDSGRGWQQEAATRGSASAGLVSQRRIAEQLQIPRDRLPALFATLRQLVETCCPAEGGGLRLGRGGHER